MIIQVHIDPLQCLVHALDVITGEVPTAALPGVIVTVAVITVFQSGN